MAFFSMNFPQQIHGIFVIVTIFEPRKLNLRDITLLLALKARDRALECQNDTSVFINFISGAYLVKLEIGICGGLITATTLWHFSHWVVGHHDPPPNRGKCATALMIEYGGIEYEWCNVGLWALAFRDQLILCPSPKSCHSWNPVSYKKHKNT